LPIYRSGSVHKSTAPDIASRKWIQDHGLDNIGRFSAMHHGGQTKARQGGLCQPRYVKDGKNTVHIKFSSNG